MMRRGYIGKTMIRIGIAGCSEIAYRRFLPASEKIDQMKVVAVAEEYDRSKLRQFTETYGIEGLNSFDELIQRTDIDAIYIPQPPALHYKWAKRALDEHKHVLIEKPSTTSYADTMDLVHIAETNGLALHENYMFIYHEQIQAIHKIIASGELGEIRLMRADFGFPLREKNDFRYVKELGGGALLDAGGYALRLATVLLGHTVHVDAAQLNKMQGYDVDMYGSAQLSNENGEVCQIAFGMDCEYRCSLEIWGSKGKLFTHRIFTAPSSYEPLAYIEHGGATKKIVLPTDDSFEKSIRAFLRETTYEDKRKQSYEAILTQAKLVEDFRTAADQVG